MTYGLRRKLNKIAEAPEDWNADEGASREAYENEEIHIEGYGNMRRSQARNKVKGYAEDIAQAVLYDEFKGNALNKFELLVHFYDAIYDGDEDWITMRHRLATKLNRNK